MGKRESFSSFEAIVHDLYEKKLLTKEMLITLWREMSKYLEMDAGGYGYRQTADGKHLPQIIVETLGIADRVALYIPEEEYQRTALQESEDYFVEICNMYFWNELYHIQDWSKV